MKLAEFVENVDFKNLYEQEVRIVANIMLEDEGDFLNNEVLKRTKFYAGEFSPDDVEFYNELGIEVQTEDLEVVFAEDYYGRKLVKDVDGYYYIVF